MRALVRLVLLGLLGLALMGNACGGGGWTSPHEPLGRELYASPQFDPLALTPDGSRLYVANTTSHSVSVIDTATNTELVHRIRVGLDPVSVAVRPDGLEVWVANHISDSVSVIDSDPTSPSYHQVIATIQDLDADGSTLFDEPVGIAFASNTKAYVALSSRNEIAVVTISGSDHSVSPTRLPISAQDPRALRVFDSRLFVLAFESGNQSELSVCAFEGPAGDTQCTFGATSLQAVAAGNPNLPGIPKNVVRDPDVPDRDLFVFSTGSDTQIQVVEHVGTLLYGMAFSSTGKLYVTNTDARNADVDDQGNPDGNGLAAPVASGRGLGLGLEDLQNRLFHNRITTLDCVSSCLPPVASPLEPAPGLAVGTPMATPYGIAVTGDDVFLVVTAAASNRLATVLAAAPGPAGIIDSISVGDIPRGLALYSPPATSGGTAYVLNTLGNSVSVVDVSPAGALTPVAEIPVGDDPTPEAVRLGRIAFNSAAASSSGTFACASCHPDANVDQLLWVIGASCDDCDQEEMRSTMPVRGLANTLPLHWDGSLGDPFGGPNGEIGVGGSESPLDCSLASGQQECFRHLVNASLSAVMCDQPSCPAGPTGLAGLLTNTERENMATFLQSVSYPPAPKRAIDDVLSTAAVDGFADFFLDQGGNGGGVAQTCADTTGGCHALPLGVSTNSSAVGAFDAPTMRGLTDRFLQFSGGFTNPQEILDVVALVGLGYGVIPWDPDVGLDEKVVFSAAFTAFNPVYNVFPDDMFAMFEEASTGPSGATGRMVTLNVASASGGAQAATYALLDDLEAADARGVVNVYGDGERNGTPVSVSFIADPPPGVWQVGPAELTRAQLESEVEAGTLFATVTAHMPTNWGEATHPMSLLTVATVGSGPNGDPNIPRITGGGSGNPMSLSGVAVRADARILVDGQPDAGTVSCSGGPFAPFCSTELISVDLAAIPGNGLHLLQLQNGDGAVSPEMPFCVGNLSGDCL